MTRPLLPVASPFELAFEFGRGSWLYSQSGERYLDFASGIAVNALGHGHPRLIRALKTQAGKLWHTSNLVRVPEAERLAQRLTEASFADVVFFANSGGEANEAAVKMARKHHSATGRPERYRVVTFDGAFHGRSLAMIAATGYAKYLEGFGPKVDGFDQAVLGDWQGLDALLSAQTAAIMLEPVQGEGGLRTVEPEILIRLRQICDERGLLLILDEVQSGVGRTGKLFAHEWSGIKPDIVTLAKGIGGGFPMGACLATREAAKGMLPGSHGTTFGGNPLAMAVGNAVLDIVLDAGFFEHVLQMAELFRELLVGIQRQHGELICDVRGAGLLQGLRLHGDPLELVHALHAERMLSVPARDGVVRFAPPLTVRPREIKEAARRIQAACTALRAKSGSRQSRPGKPAAAPSSATLGLRP
ncbi:aspartate aminotransferase family protein [Bosea sp. (in: a-proteobacteria)]|uniref:aspartate aminotransferase family protein n=1 Tax=Bosea sp. (in: a-proteobacteria) TaxID=1871050 RepID=UPI001AD030C0|nr:aspartate aminotransferase family protein [Bosea sp. (in: a-proteobacteria)]MBN9437986.1 aspartate aminotransferase family protein [Bosea sp. (in: a-proteobacteria)]